MARSRTTTTAERDALSVSAPAHPDDLAERDAISALASAREFADMGHPMAAAAFDMARESAWTIQDESRRQRLLQRIDGDQPTPVNQAPELGEFLDGLLGQAAAIVQKWTAVCSRCGQTYIADHPVIADQPAICSTCHHVAHQSPDASGVFRRPPHMAERLMVTPASLIAGRWQPRTAMDAAALEELTMSIRDHGVLEDLIAICNEAGQLELITGHRRAAAAIRAGVATVPVKIVEVSAAEAEALALISNDDRVDLTDVERGQAYERIITTQGISEAELSRRIGRTRSYIQQRRALARATPAVQEALTHGEITISQARGICAGAPDFPSAQAAALKYIQNRSSWQGPATEQDAQNYAEEAVLDTSKGALEELGWSVVRYANSARTLTVVFTPTTRPQSWTSTEILQALREQRRPAAVGDTPTTTATISSANRLTLSRRGWTIDTQRFAPWIMVCAPRLKFMSADELPELIAQARTDLADLMSRYTNAGWKLHTRNGRSDDSFEASTREGRKETLWSWTDAIQFIKKVETGKEPRTPDTVIRQCEHCKTTKPVSWQGAYLCQDCTTALQAEELRQRAELRAELERDASTWIAAAPEQIIRLLATTLHENERLGIQMLMNPEERVRRIRAADDAQLRTAMLDLFEALAYKWRDQDLMQHG